MTTRTDYLVTVLYHEMKKETGGFARYVPHHAEYIISATSIKSALRKGEGEVEIAQRADFTRYATAEIIAVAKRDA